jgi:hypothetical protein
MFGMTPLHLAVESGCLEVIERLATVTADVASRDHGTALFYHVAGFADTKCADMKALGKKKGVAQILVEACADIYYKDIYGTSVIDACQAQKIDMNYSCDLCRGLVLELDRNLHRKRRLSVLSTNPNTTVPILPKGKH